METYKPSYFIGRSVKFYEKPQVVNIDYDGTVTYIEKDGVEYHFPDHGPIRPLAIEACQLAARLGFKLVLNTCRSESNGLNVAVDRMKEAGIHFDSINKPLKAKWWRRTHGWLESHPTKLAGHIYLEDKAWPPQDMDVVWLSFIDYLKWWSRQNENRRTEAMLFSDQKPILPNTHLRPKDMEIPEMKWQGER
jgi:hypothetical protein